MFEFTSPQTLDDALQLWHDKARWFAGGTDLVSGLAPDFDFTAVLLDPAIDRVNVSPFSTLAHSIVP